MVCQTYYKVQDDDQMEINSMHAYIISYNAYKS